MLHEHVGIRRRDLTQLRLINLHHSIIIDLQCGYDNMLDQRQKQQQHFINITLQDPSLEHARVVAVYHRKANYFDDVSELSRRDQLHWLSSEVNTAINLLHITTASTCQQIHYAADVNWHHIF